MVDKPVLAIIGAGNLGVALACLFSRNGYRVLLGSRDPAVTVGKISKFSTLHSASLEVLLPVQAATLADICLLTVPDQEINRVCDRLAQHFNDDSTVAHCSGVLDSSELAAARQRNIAVCSVHPLNTFPSIDAGVQTLRNNDHATHLYGEGDNLAVATINQVFESAGFHTTTIARASKPLYHAACVFACNYLTVLMDLSLQTAEAGKLDEKIFWQALQPLIVKTIENIGDGDTASALSGPVARADSKTVSLHAEALDRISGPIATTYLDLGRHALSLAVRHGKLDDAQVAALEKALNRD